MATPKTEKTLGSLVSAIRRENGWTLKQMSDVVGIPLSTLGKVESDKLSLSFDKIQQLTQRLGISMADFFGQSGDGGDDDKPVTARRSVTGANNSVQIETQNYNHDYLCSDLTHKRMVPIIAQIKARTPEEFGEPLSHPGEEFVYVLEGEVQVNLAYYRPTVLKKGEGMYIDSMMPHSYTLGDCQRAVLLAVCSGDEFSLQSPHLELGSDPETLPSV